MKPFVLIHARSFAEAARATVRPDAELKAGGVDLIDRMKEGLDSPKTVVSISKIAGHDGIETGPPARIGALGLARWGLGYGRCSHREVLSPDVRRGAGSYPVPPPPCLVRSRRMVATDSAWVRAW